MSLKVPVPFTGYKMGPEQPTWAWTVDFQTLEFGQDESPSTVLLKPADIQESVSVAALLKSRRCGSTALLCSCTEGCWQCRIHVFVQQASKCYCNTSKKEELKILMKANLHTNESYFCTHCSPTSSFILFSEIQGCIIHEELLLDRNLVSISHKMKKQQDFSQNILGCFMQ